MPTITEQLSGAKFNEKEILVALLLENHNGYRLIFKNENEPNVIVSVSQVEQILKDKKQFKNVKLSDWNFGLIIEGQKYETFLDFDQKRVVLSPKNYNDAYEIRKIDIKEFFHEVSNRIDLEQVYIDLYEKQENKKFDLLG